MHINVYFKECVNGAIKKSDQFTQFFCVPLRMYEIYFSTGKKKNKQSESTTIGRF